MRNFKKRQRGRIAIRPVIQFSFGNSSLTRRVLIGKAQSQKAQAKRWLSNSLTKDPSFKLQLFRVSVGKLRNFKKRTQNVFYAVKRILSLSLFVSALIRCQKRHYR